MVDSNEKKRETKTKKVENQATENLDVQEKLDVPNSRYNRKFRC